MASQENTAEKYRYYLSEDDVKSVEWRFGSPPNYDVVNKLFEEGRTNIWAPGSLEEKVQNIVKTWEMEMFHKVKTDEYITVDPVKFRFCLNGREALSLEGIRKLGGGGYNSMLQTSLPEKFRCFDPDKETAESGHRIFTTVFPRGFALEILRVYSGPPVIVYKFRHWGFMEGSFKGHSPTGEMVEFFGMAIFELDENSKIVKVEFFFDLGELLGPLVKGGRLDDLDEASSSCPVLRNTG